MSAPDLTRWNRAGLQRFSYVDGNAANFLDELRGALLERFPGRWQKQLLPPDDGSESETDPEWIKYARSQRLLEQYRPDERGDIGWEIVRTFARTCHVLTGHIDAHANEGFLRTATQWDSVRRLVDMLDYHPMGATSATTSVAILA